MIIIIIIIIIIKNWFLKSVYQTETILKSANVSYKRKFHVKTVEIQSM
jgi:hypothetical protein